MAQPDRGALFRIDFTGQVPFEMQSIHVRPRGFRVVFTTPVDQATADDPTSYRLEHYRYEYTGAYGSPELDRTRGEGRKGRGRGGRQERGADDGAAGEGSRVSVDARGVRSATGKRLVHPTGAYTLNEIPPAKQDE